MKLGGDIESYGKETRFPSYPAAPCNSRGFISHNLYFIAIYPCCDLLFVIYTCRLAISLLVRRMFSQDQLALAGLSGVSSPPSAGGWYRRVGSERRWPRIACASPWAGESRGCPGCARGLPASFLVCCSQSLAVMLLYQLSFSIHRIFLLDALSFLF